MIARIIRERDVEGLTYFAIAERLNVEGVPTAHGGRRWWANTVWQVLRSQAAAEVRAERDR